MSHRPMSFFLNVGDKEESFEDSLEAVNFNQSAAFFPPIQKRQREASVFISPRDNGFSASDKNRDYTGDVRHRGGNPNAAARPAASYILDDEYAEDNDQENIMHGNAEFKLPPRLLARLKSRNPSNKEPLVKQENARLDKAPVSVLQNVENVSLCRRDTYIKAPKISGNDFKKALAEANNGSALSELNSTITKTPTQSQANCTASIRAATLHFDEDDVRYINWLNSVILMSFDIENVKVDLGRIVNDVVVPSEVRTAAGGPIEPLKDGVSSLAYKEAKLMDALRVKAHKLYSEQMKLPAELLDTDLKVGKYCIRHDKNVMTDVGAKKYVLEIFLNYNPLWLKVALECVFNTRIEKMGKRSEVHTLMSVLSTRLLNFNQLAKKRGFKNTTTFFMKADNVLFAKRHIFYHFVLLVHFLDIAKRARLIEHDPCLFRIDASCKSTRDILVAFAREYITGVGDITKALRNIGVDLVHVQLPIEQFNFTINKLASDIRDGVRLARLAEIMLKRNDILPKLQFPPDSITRKIHNMELVFKVFERQWLTPLPKGLIARDVANGNRQRTIQLLDKLIELYNDRLRLAQLEASIGSVLKIQRWWRAYLACKQEREAYIKLRNATIFIQQHYRLKLQAVAQRNEFLQLKSAALVVQRRFRANQLMKLEQNRFQTMRSATLIIQIRLRAYLAMKEAREGFLAIRKATMFVQQTWRQKKLAQKERQQFLTIRASVLTLQTAARGYLARKYAAEVRLRTNAALTIQRHFRANQLMKQQRALFLAKRNAAITIQRFYRGYRQMVADRASFLEQRDAAIVLQKYWRGRVARKSFLELRTSALTIQRQFRANQLMKQEREQYLAKRTATVTIQRFYRGYRQMVADRSAFIQQREAAIVLQKYWRGRVARKSYIELRTSTVTIQRHFRLLLQTRTQRAIYLELKERVIFVQRTWRLKQLAKADRATFVLQKASATVIQRAFRAHRERKQFIELRQASISIQQRFRANREARLQRSRFLAMKSAAIVIQRAWRRHHRLQELTSAALVVQRLYRAKLATRQAVAEFQTKRQAAVTIQQKFRAWTIGRKERAEYVRLRSAAILIQRRYREKKRGNKFIAVVVEYCAKVQMSATRIQALWRGVRVRRAQDKMQAVLPIIRQQIQSANESAIPEKTIGAKMVAIMERIKKLRTINLLYKETETIEEYTDVSREICQFIVEHIEVMDTLLSATDHLNRSEPHKKVFSNILGIILNLVTKTDTTLLYNRNDIFVMVGKVLRINSNSVQFKNGRANACPLITRALQVLVSLLEDGPSLQNFKSDTNSLDFTRKLLTDITKLPQMARNTLRGSQSATQSSPGRLLYNTAMKLKRQLK